MWNSIQLGDDVYLECYIQANPQVYNVTWRHNVSYNKTKSLMEGLKNLKIYGKFMGGCQRKPMPLAVLMEELSMEWQLCSK